MNESQKFVTIFSDEGIHLKTTRSDRDWELGLKFVGYGWEDQPLIEVGSGELIERGTRVEIRRPNITEWFVNNERGLEQGWTIDQAPNGDGDYILLNIEAETTLIPELRYNNQHVKLKHGKLAQLHYGGLKVYDADGHILDSEIQISERNWTIKFNASDAIFPITVDPTIFEKQIITPADLAPGDEFGAVYGASIFGDVAVIGSSKDDDNGTESGSGYIFRKEGGLWIEKDKVTASDGQPFDNFGRSASVAGDRAIFGVRFDDDQGNSSGSAYVFRNTGNDNWLQVAKLIPVTAGPADEFGWAITQSGSDALISARFDDDMGSDAGAVYYFREQGTDNWNEIQKIFPSNPQTDMLFGWNIKLVNDVAAITSFAAKPPESSGFGYVFQKIGGTFQEQQILIPADVQPDDNFGASLGFDGQVLAIGAPKNDDMGVDKGVVYIFENQAAAAAQSGVSFVQTDKVFSVNPTISEDFGCFVSVENGVLYVCEKVGITTSIQAYQKDSSGSWSNIGTLNASVDIDSPFSIAVGNEGKDVIFPDGRADIIGMDSGVALYFDVSGILQDIESPILVNQSPINLSPQGPLTFSVTVQDVDTGIDLEESQVFFQNETGDVLSAIPTVLPNNQVQYSATFPAGTNPGVVKVNGLISDNADPNANTLTFTDVEVGKILANPSAQGQSQGPNFIVTYTGNHPFDTVNATLTNPNGTTGTAQVLTPLPSQIVQVQYSDFQGNANEVAQTTATLHYQDSNFQPIVDLNVTLGGGGGSDPQGPGSQDPSGLELVEQIKGPHTYATKHACDPIDLFTGSFIMDVPDLTIPGRGINFEWTRTHNGNIIYPKTFELGTSWFNPYLQRLIQKGNDIDFLEGSGRIDTFTSNGVGGFNTPSHHYLELTHNIAAGEFTLKADANLRWVFHDFAQTNAGRLKFVVDRFGNQLSFDYIQINSEPKLKTVTDTFGRVITMTHDSQGRITEVQDFSSDFGSTGRKVSYTYYPPASAGGTDGQLQSVQAPEITGTSTNNDFDIAGLNRKTTTYTYTHGFANESLRHNIATITDPKGQVYVKNTFATTQNENDLLFNRVIEQQYGEEDQNFQLHYENINETIGNQTATLLIIVNDRRGLINEHRLNDFGNPVSIKEFTGFADPDQVTTQTSNRPTGKLRSTDPDFYETQTDYDSLGKPIEVTLPRGNKLITAYDDLAAEEHGQDNMITFTCNVGTVGTIGGIDTDLTTQMTYTDNVFAFIKTMTNPRSFLWEFFYDFDEEPDNTDYNGDGVITPLAQSQGFLFQKKSPDVNLGLSGSQNPQVIEEQFEYNQFSQITKYTDPEGNVTAFIYYPENDPDGDGQNIIAGRDPNTGGYLKQRIVAEGTGTEALNLTTEYEYDDVGNVITVIKPLGYRWSYEVNALNQVVRTTSPTMALFDSGDTYEQFLKYDANDNVIEAGIEHENASNPGFANGPGFDEANFFETRFEFDILDNLITKTEEVGNSFPAIYDYDTLVTSYEYDDSYNLVRITHPNDTDEDALLYDERDLLFQQIIGDADTLVSKSITQWDYDLNRNMSRTDYPNANGAGFNEETCVYDGFDRKISCFSKGRNTTWTFAYDKADNQTLKRADGPFDTNQGTVVKLSEVRTIFDEIDRPFRLEQDLFRHDTGLGLNSGALTLAVSELAYDADSRLIQTVNPNLHNTFYTYDQADRLKTETDAVGNIAEYFYDLNSMVTQMVNTEVKPNGPADVFTWDFEYDERDQMRTTNDDLNQLTQIAIDSRGFVASRTDAEGNQWLSLRDGLGREYQSDRQVTDVDFLTLKNKFDERSRLITFTDAENRETAYQYDSHNRKILKTNADLTTCQYFYDVADNLVTRIRENDDVITYEYDDADRLILTQYRIDTNPANAPEIADDWAYNGLDALVFAGERLDTQDPLGGFKFQESYLYESRGLPLDCTQIIGTFSAKTFSKDYDAAGNQLFLDYPNGRRVSYNTYDDLERLTNLTSGPVNITTTYRGYNRWHERDFGNTLTLDVEYDATKRITDFNHQDNNVTPLPEVKVGFQVGYDQVSNKLSELLSRSDKPSKGRIFDYDNYYRTTEFASDLDVTTFNQGLADFSTVPTSTKFHEVNNYDLANNIEDTTLNGSFNDVTNNEMNETESIGQVIENANYDLLGRLTGYQQDGKEFALTYNRRDQLIQVDSQDIGDPGSLTAVAQYEYYSSGMRAVKIVPSESLHEHFYGPWMTVFEVYNVNSGVEDSDTSKEFIHDLAPGALAQGAQLDKPLVIFFNHDGVGRKEPYYFHTNTRGDVYALSDENGTIVERYNYSLFGETEIFPGSLEPPGNTTVISGNGFNGIVAPPQNINGGEFTNESRFGNIYGFGGAYLDYETRFYQMRFRYYFPTLRGFISRDPIWDDSLMNGYAFVENRPGYLIDPWGLAPWQGGTVNPQDIIDEIIELENRGMSVEDILENLSENHKGLTKRYIYTDRFGWIDVRHFFKAADFAQDIGSVSTESLGFMLEVFQWATEWGDAYRSGFSSEDLPSNAAGAMFGDDYLKDGVSVSDAFQDFLNKIGGRDQDDPKAGKDQLPTRDPSLPPLPAPGENAMGFESNGS